MQELLLVDLIDYIIIFLFFFILSLQWYELIEKVIAMISDGKEMEYNYQIF
jgi:hypothetical protein